MLNRSSFRAGAVVIGLALMTTACGTDASAPHAEVSSSTSPSSLKTPISHTVPSSPSSESSSSESVRVPALGTTIDIASARPAQQGSDFQDLGTIEGTGSAAGFRRLTMTPDGEAFGVIGGADPKRQVGQTPTLLDPENGQVIRIPWPASHPSPKGTILYASATDRWVVWTIAVAPDLDETPWQLFSYDRKRRITRYLGAAVPNVDGKYPTAPGYSVPSIDQNGNVYIAAVVPDPPGTTPTNVIQRVPADGSSPLKNYLTDAITPSSWRNDLVWATLVHGNLQFWHRNLDTDTDTKLYDGTGTDCNSEFGLATAGHRTAWLLQCAHKGGDILQVFTPGKPTVSIRGTDLGYLEMTTHYVSVAPQLADGSYAQDVYNLNTGRLMRIGDGDVIGDTPGNGDILTWGSTTVGNPTELTTHMVRLLDTDRN